MSIYRPLGSVLSFPIPIRNTLGQLADPDAQSVLLFSDEVAQATQGQGVTIRKSADGLFWADAASATEGMETFFAWGRRIRAASRQVSIDGESGFGDFLDGVYVMGEPPGSSGSGSKIVTLTVKSEATGDPIQNVRVTAYDPNGRFAGTGVSDASGEIRLHLNPGAYDLSSPSLPGLWQMADPSQSIDVTADGSNAFDVEFAAMSIVFTEPAKAAGWIVLVDEKGKPIEGSAIYVVPHKAPESGVNSTGVSPPNDPWMEESGADGGIVFGPTDEEPEQGMLQGWDYRIWGEAIGITEDERAIVTVPYDPPDGAFSLRSFIRNTGSAA